MQPQSLMAWDFCWDESDYGFYVGIGTTLEGWLEVAGRPTKHSNSNPKVLEDAVLLLKTV